MTYPSIADTMNSQDAVTIVDELLVFQIVLEGSINCTEWIDTYVHVKLQDMGTQLAMFIRQRCCCEFPSTLITRAHFTCPSSHPPPPHPQHVTYRASIAPTGQLNRTMLEAVLREWPAIHRAILLQGELLSVDHTCPVIISSFDKECIYEVSSEPVTAFVISLGTFLGSVVSAVVVAFVAVMVMTFSLCALYNM